MVTLGACGTLQLTGALAVANIINIAPVAKSIPNIQHTLIFLLAINPASADKGLTPPILMLPIKSKELNIVVLQLFSNHYSEILSS